MTADLIPVRERGVLDEWLRRDVFLHLYALGDLDDAFWPLTTWYAYVDDARAAVTADAIRALLLRYEPGHDLTVVLALSGPEGRADLTAALERLVPRLPRRVYCHVTPGVEVALRSRYALAPHGPHRKMALVRPEALAAFDDAGAVTLEPADEAEARALYAVAYPATWFDPAMLAKGPYLGIRDGGRRDGSGALVAIAGVHVWSPRQGVAALGNIATHPAARGRGLATRLTAALCRRCLAEVRHVGLNVHADNAAAIRVYEKLGFVVNAPYDEYDATAAV